MRQNAATFLTAHAKGTKMKRLASKFLTAAAVLAPLAAMTPAPAAAQAVTKPTQDIAMSIGRGQLITVPGRMTDVFVADDTIADVQVKSTNQLYVFGKAGGVTTVYASGPGGAVVWSATIRVGSNIDTVDQMLRLAMPDAKINVATIGVSTVLLTGTISAPEDAADRDAVDRIGSGLPGLAQQFGHQLRQRHEPWVRLRRQRQPGRNGGRPGTPAQGCDRNRRDGGHEFDQGHRRLS